MTPQFNKLSETFTTMNVKNFNSRARQAKAQFNKLLQELIEYASTREGQRAINAVDGSAVRKLLRWPNDISPARLVSITDKILTKQAGGKVHKRVTYGD